MSLTLRGHHLLCVHGFQGMGYSPEFIEKMKEIVKQIRDDQLDFPIKVVAAFDDACSTCPNRGETACEAKEDSNEHVLSMDNRVLHQLGLTDGDIYSKSFLVQLTTENIKPDDLDYICKGCSWLPYGTCKDGIQALRQKFIQD